MSSILKYNNSRIEIYTDKIIYKKLFKKAITINFNEVKNLSASLYAQSRGLIRGQYMFDLFLLKDKWHIIDIRTFPYFNAFRLKKCFEIYLFLIDTLAPQIISKNIDIFNNGNDLKLGLLTINKNIGIIKTNNVKREIPWRDITLLELTANQKCIWSGVLKFNNENKNEIFEFQFNPGNIKEYDVLIAIFELMKGKEMIQLSPTYVDFIKYHLELLKRK